MTSDATARAERLAGELEAAFRNRADLYRLLLEELTATMGRAGAVQILDTVLERRGAEVAATAFAGFGPNQARALGEAFLEASPDGGRMYPTEVTRTDDTIAFQVLRCPLKDAWQAARVSDEDLATLCRLAGAFDRGLFKGCGVHFENRTWTPEQGDGCCWIRLSPFGR